MIDSYRLMIRSAIRRGDMNRALFLVGIVVLYRLATGDIVRK